MKGAISNLEAAIQHIKNNDIKAAGAQAEYAHSKLNPKAFCPSPRCKCWGVAIQRKGKMYFERNMTLAQANGRFNALSGGMADDAANITGIWVVAFYNGIERREI